MKNLLRTILSGFCAIYGVSCTIGYGEDIAMTTKAGNVTSYKRSRNIIVQGPGGTASQKGSNGYSLVTDNQQSARDIGTAIGSAYAAHAAQATNASNNALEGVKSTNGLNQHISDNDLQAKLAETARKQAADPILIPAVKK